MKKMICLLLAFCLALALAACGAAAPAAAEAAEEPVSEETQESDVILSDDSSDFVLLSEAVPDVILEIRYYSTYNFVGDRID